MTISSGRERSVCVRKGAYDRELAKWGGRQPDTNWILPLYRVDIQAGREKPNSELLPSHEE